LGKKHRVVADSNHLRFIEKLERNLPDDGRWIMLQPFSHIRFPAENESIVALAASSYGALKRLSTIVADSPHQSSQFAKCNAIRNLHIAKTVKKQPKSLIVEYIR
jgi:cyclopropane fatty-acyl-phospholipid synthase-like methyltransferase